jgi:hypothetical protein
MKCAHEAEKKEKTFFIASRKKKYFGTHVARHELFFSFGARLELEEYVWGWILRDDMVWVEVEMK